MREPDQIDPEAVIDYAVEIVKSCVTSAGHRNAGCRLPAMQFFLSPKFQGLADALDLSDGTRERILALVRARNRAARSL
jgi:hypothetical protein